MKKIAVIIIALCIAFAVIGCASKPPAASSAAATSDQSARVPGSFPDFVKASRRSQESRSYHKKK